jgi:transcriptional regulator with XRE-family HTH domain
MTALPSQEPRPPKLAPGLSFGIRVRLLRKWHGMSTRELAERCGRCRRTIIGFENESHTPDMQTIEALALALGIHPLELIPETSTPPENGKAEGLPGRGRGRSRVHTPSEKIKTPNGEGRWPGKDGCQR